MANAKSIQKTAQDLGLTPHEERLLQAYFRRQTRPYLVGLLIAGSALGVLLAVGFPERAELAETDPALEIAQLKTEIETRVSGELGDLRVQLAVLEESLASSEQQGSAPASGDALKRMGRVDGKLSRLGRRLDEIEKQNTVTLEQLAAIKNQLERSLVDAALAQRRSAATAADAAGAQEPAVAPASDADIAFE